MKGTVELTAEQKKVVRGVPGLAERAARDTTLRFGSFRPMPEMVRSAHYGIALAARSFDAARGSTFDDWAYYKACCTIVDDARVERRQLDKILAARSAAMEFLRFQQRPEREEDVYATPQQDRASLDDYKGGLVAAMLERIAATPDASGSEDDMIARVDAARAAAALKKVYESLRPEQVELLGCESEADLQSLAPRWGKTWWTLARARNKLQQIVGARLAGRGVDAMPAWDDEVWGAASGASEAPVAP